jgi:hypothetical protein
VWGLDRTGQTKWCGVRLECNDVFCVHGFRHAPLRAYRRQEAHASRKRQESYPKRTDMISQHHFVRFKKSYRVRISEGLGIPKEKTTLQYRHQPPRAATHVVTAAPRSSPAFFLSRKSITSGTASLGVPSPMTLLIILAFARMVFDDFLDLGHILLEVCGQEQMDSITSH